MKETIRQYTCKLCPNTVCTESLNKQRKRVRVEINPKQGKVRAVHRTLIKDCLERKIMKEGVRK